MADDDDLKEGDHQAKVRKSAAHKRKNSGCVIRCVTKYEEKNTHSHRWNAAEKARKEGLYDSIDFEANVPIPNMMREELVRLQDDKGLVSGVKGTPRKNPKNELKPFYRRWHPFHHEAHHVIGISVLWKSAITPAVKLAKQDEPKMLDAVIDSFLKEPYNHNDKPNMIVLPTTDRYSDILGLPKHTNGQPEHTDYDKPIAVQVEAEIPPKFGPLADQVNAGVHKNKLKLIKVGEQLIAISNFTYDAIIALAKGKTLKRKTLDQKAKQIAKKAASLAAKAAGK